VTTYIHFLSTPRCSWLLERIFTYRIQCLHDHVYDFLLRVCVLFDLTSWRCLSALSSVGMTKSTTKVLAGDRCKRQWRSRRTPVLTLCLYVRWWWHQRLGIGKGQLLLAVRGQEHFCSDCLFFRASCMILCVPHIVVVRLHPRATCRHRVLCGPPLPTGSFHVIRDLLWCHGPPFSAVFRVAWGGPSFGHDIL